MINSISRNASIFVIVNITSPEINLSSEINLYVDSSHEIPLISANLIQLNRIVRNKIRE